MDTVMLKVTRKVLAQSQNSPDQRQIAISDASNPELKAQFEMAGKNRKIRLLLARRISLCMGDTGAIWYSHNRASKKNQDDFDQLFLLLAHHPDAPFQFICEVVAD